MKVGEYKSPSGLIRAEVETEGDLITKVTFTGDFFVYPEESLANLEDHLIKIKKDKVLENIKDFYRKNEINSPRIGPKDWFTAVKRALEEEDE